MVAEPQFRVLVVDDQRDLARAIRLAVEELGDAFEAIDVPSAEEALLEARQKPVDVLIADVRLPGLTGDVLVQRVREMWPGVKVILITGLPREEAQELAQRLSADAFFHKPFEMADLLDAVERQVGVVESALGATPSPLLSGPEQVKQRLSALLADTRRALDLRSVMLLGESGYALVRAGEFPEGMDEPRLVTRLMAVLSAGGKVLRLWQNEPHRCMHLFPAPGGTLLMTSIEARFALVAWDEKPYSEERLTQAATALWTLTTQVEEVLRQWKLLPPQTGAPEPSLAPAESAEPLAEDSAEGEVSEELLALLKPDGSSPAPEEAEAFWEALMSEDLSAASTAADVLSFDEAKRLGLVPFAGEDESE